MRSRGTTKEKKIDISKKKRNTTYKGEGKSIRVLAKAIIGYFPYFFTINQSSLSTNNQVRNSKLTTWSSRQSLSKG